MADYKEKVNDMKMQEVRNIAKERGLKAGSKMSKTDIIRSIQRAEGNTDCFGTEHVNICGQINCLWREDCLAMQKA